MTESTTSRQKNQSKYSRRRKILFVGLFLLCAYFAVSIIGIQIDNYKQRQQLAAINNSIEEQKLENDELLRIVGNSDEADYIEQIAREKLGYAAPGERVFVDVAGTGGNSADESTERTSDSEAEKTE